MARMLTPDQLVAELQEIAAEMVARANEGSYPAREWLLQSFPGHVSYFRYIWRKPEPMRAVIKVHATRTPAQK